MSRFSVPVIALALFAVCLSSRPGRADSLDRLVEEVNLLARQSAGLGPKYLKGGKLSGSQYVAERLVDGENIYRVKDYERAAIIFIDIIENHVGHTAYPDALFLYADCLFLSEDYVGARKWFKEFLNQSNLPGAGRYRDKAIARLVETAIHLNDYEDVDGYVDLLRQSPSDEARYVRGKYLFFKGDLESAKSMFQSITAKSEVKYKAEYMLGVALTQQGNYEAAIKVFLEGSKAAAADRTEQEIVDLMKLGAGRLYYEQGLLFKASQMYEQIPQSSPYFDAALYEGASVLVQEGDTVRAEQALEVIAIAVPESRYLPKAKMLRGNLLLRAGRYDAAERIFDELVDEFTPLTAQLERVMNEREDTQKFFFDLVERSMSALDVSAVLPPVVVKWVGEEPEVQRALNLARDLGAAKGYVKETERLVRLLATVVDGPSRINAIPLLREGMRRAQQISNRLSQLRGALSMIAEEELGDQAPGLMQLSSTRRQLGDRLKTLPTTAEEFKARELKSREVFSRMKNELQRNAIRLDRLNAMTVAIERFVDDPKHSQGVPSANLKAVLSEVGRHRQAIKEMQKNLDDLRIDIERAGYQVGVGDRGDIQDREIRKQAVALSRQEWGIIQGQRGKDAERIVAAFNAINGIERRLAGFQKEIAVEADRRVDDIRRQVYAERDRIAGYYNELSAVGSEAETVVGGVAFENFSSVRKRFHELVLKADVGIIDSAWLRKESHTARISELTGDRLKNIKRLDDEFQEVKREETE
jgi:TolA-binding protein